MLRNIAFTGSCQVNTAPVFALLRIISGFACILWELSAKCISMLPHVGVYSGARSGFHRCFTENSRMVIRTDSSKTVNLKAAEGCYNKLERTVSVTVCHVVQCLTYKYRLQVLCLKRVYKFSKHQWNCTNFPEWKCLSKLTLWSMLTEKRGSMAFTSSLFLWAWNKGDSYVQFKLTIGD